MVGADRVRFDKLARKNTIRGIEYFLNVNLLSCY